MFFPVSVTVNRNPHGFSPSKWRRVMIQTHWVAARYPRSHKHTFSLRVMIDCPLQAIGLGFKQVEHLPANSNSRLFGGNSNWRGPIRFPINAQVIGEFLLFYYNGDSFTIECPTGSGTRKNLFEVAQELAARMIQLPGSLDAATFLKAGAPGKALVYRRDQSA